MSIVRKCKFCGKEFKTYEAWIRNGNAGMYCSKSCASKAAVHSNRHIKLICQECGKEYEVKEYRKNESKYCSNQCRRKHMPKGEMHPNWKGGISERSIDIRKAIKKAIERDGRCMECGSLKNLQGHHIVPVSDNPNIATDIENIITLCANCHALKHKDIKNMIEKPNKRSGTTKKCINCGKEIYVMPYQENSKLYCSVKCKNQHHVAQVEKVCEFCGKKYRVIKSRAVRSRFCSWECYINGKMDTKN